MMSWIDEVVKETMNIRRSELGVQYGDNDQHEIVRRARSSIGDSDDAMGNLDAIASAFVAVEPK